MFCFEILMIFGEKLQMSKYWKSGHFGLLCLSIGNPRRSVDLHQGVECLAAARLRCQNGTPRVHHGVSKLRCGEGLRRSVAVLRRGVPTVHRGQNFEFLFRKSSFCTSIV